MTWKKREKEGGSLRHGADSVIWRGWQKRLVWSKKKKKTQAFSSGGETSREGVGKKLPFNNREQDPQKPPQKKGAATEEVVHRGKTTRRVEHWRLRDGKKKCVWTKSHSETKRVDPY